MLSYDWMEKIVFNFGEIMDQRPHPRVADRYLTVT